MRAGPYRLVREIGRGGIGTVYLAERANCAFERQLALNSAGWIAGAERRPPKAIQLHQPALTIYEASMGLDHPDLA